MNISILIYLMVFMPIVGAFVSYLIGRKNKKARDYFVSGLTVLELVLAVVLGVADVGHEGSLVYVAEICGMRLAFTMDGFHVLYAAIACFM